MSVLHTRLVVVDLHVQKLARPIQIEEVDEQHVLALVRQIQVLAGRAVAVHALGHERRRVRVREALERVHLHCGGVEDERVGEHGVGLLVEVEVPVRIVLTLLINHYDKNK